MVIIPLFPFLLNTLSSLLLSLPPQFYFSLNLSLSFQYNHQSKALFNQFNSSHIAVLFRCDHWSNSLWSFNISLDTHFCFFVSPTSLASVSTSQFIFPMITRQIFSLVIQFNFSFRSGFPFCLYFFIFFSLIPLSSFSLSPLNFSLIIQFNFFLNSFLFLSHLHISVLFHQTLLHSHFRLTLKLSFLS